jgi:predicted nucleotidyltransferase
MGRMKVTQLPFALDSEKRALNELSRGASRIPTILRLVAFGSRVRGDFRGDSDFDILVIIKDISERAQVVRFIYDVEVETDAPLSPVIFTEAEYRKNRALCNPFVMNVEREGVVLYDAQQR